MAWTRVSLLSFLFVCSVVAETKLSRQEYECGPSGWPVCVYTNVVITHADAHDAVFSYEKFLPDTVLFRNSSMKTVPVSLVRPLGRLGRLDLSDLQIERIDELADVDGVTINELLLTNNSIERFPSHVFHGIKKLRQLLVDGNNLANLPVGTFDRSSDLCILSLANNYLERIEDGIFKNSGQLYDINLASNKLTHVDLSLIPRLRYANVSFNQLTLLSVPAELRTLDASHNLIHTVTAVNGTSLVAANLRHNRLSDTAWLVRFAALTTLDLSFNDLEELPNDHFTSMHHLTQLLLQNNRLVRLELRQPVRSLRVLDVSHNRLVQVEESKEQFELLTELYLAHNAIVTLTIGSNNTLQNVTLAHNDWDCKSLRELLTDRLVQVAIGDTDRNCREERLSDAGHGLCCKQTTTLSRSIRSVDSEFDWGAYSRNLTYRANLREIERLEEENRKVNRTLQQHTEVHLDLLSSIDSHLNRFKLTKYGLVKPSVNLRTVFTHLANRDTNALQTSEAKRTEYKSIKSLVEKHQKDVPVLQNELNELNREWNVLKQKTADVKRELKRLRNNSAISHKP
uniref:Leucine rich immune protein (Short) n=1 Tax=Anopheles dirus TaxID=7168 RepID=A0A182NJP5_9DIPT